MLVAFPIGLFVTSFIFDLLGVGLGYTPLFAAAWYCIVAGLIGGVLAAVAGAVDFFTVVPPNSSAKGRGYRHAIMNAVVLALFIAEAAHRETASPADRTSLVLSAIAVVLLGVSGWLGGTLVYRNQIAVDHRYANGGKWKEVELGRWDQPVCHESDLREGQMLLAHIERSRVVVARCSDSWMAFSDRCTHKGGPLADGALVGCTVQCPWHGAQFDVLTGKVVNGPAEDGINTYQVAIHEGAVYVSPRRFGEGKQAA
jgi:nitrite reductase/ring-hydroxylating ferredoxin subunit/uncharacterized membrane protein